MREGLGKTLNIQILTDSETNFYSITMNASTTERRHLIYVKTAREAYSDRIMNHIKKVRQKQNLADAKTKAVTLTELIPAIEKTISL